MFDSSKPKKQFNLTLSSSLSQRLQSSFKQEFDERELKIYIPPQGGDYESVSENDAYPVLQRLSDDIVKSIHRSFLVLGNSGLGKTSLTLRLCRDFWDNITQYQRCPIYIYLPSKGIVSEVKKSPINGVEQKIDLLQVYLKKIGFSKQERLEIIKQPLVLFVDGYDEVDIKKNLYLLNDCSE